jgi:replicative DNA helicase
MNQPPDTTKLDRLSPHSLEAEMGVLGCCLLAPLDSLPLVIERLGLGGLAFYDLRHRGVWLAIEALSGESKPVDLVTVQQRLRDAGELEGVGGLTYLSQLMDTVPSAANLPSYLELVAEKYLLRRMLQTCARVAAEAHECVAPMELANRFSAEVSDLTASHSRVEARPVYEAFPGVIDELQSFRQGRKQMKGFSTGMNYLDNMLCGLKPAEYIIIAGRPGGGKTAVALQIAAHVAAVHEAPVGIFSLEMNLAALASRIVFQQAQVNYQAYRNGFLNELDAARLTKAMQDFKRLPLLVDESPGLSIEELAIRARRMVRQHGVKLIVIDYLQLLNGHSGTRYHDMNQRISDVSDGLMALKKELNIPFIVLAQENANRERSERERTPMLSDLKDSQKPAQDADCVMFLTDVDLSRAKRDLQSDDEVKRSLAERKLAWMQSKAVAVLPGAIRDDLEANVKRQDLFICKQRNGPTGPAALVYVKPWMRFIDAHVEDADVARAAQGVMEVPE